MFVTLTWTYEFSYVYIDLGANWRVRSHVSPSAMADTYNSWKKCPLYSALDFFEEKIIIDKNLTIFYVNYYSLLWYTFSHVDFPNHPYSFFDYKILSIATLFVASLEKLVVPSQVFTAFQNNWNGCFFYWKVFR